MSPPGLQLFPYVGGSGTDYHAAKKRFLGDMM